MDVIGGALDGVRSTDTRRGNGGRLTGVAALLESPFATFDVDGAGVDTERATWGMLGVDGADGTLELGM